jgi:hypothetical protein
MKLGWNTHLDQILEQKQLVRDYLSPIMDRISKSSSDFERQIYLWCIENYIALRQLKEGDAIITFYEQLCVEPEAEVKRLFHKLGNEFNHKVLERIRKPSAVTGKHSAILRGDNLVSAWKRELNSDQIQIALETTKLFGLNNIYDGNLLPIKTKIKLPIKDVLSYSSK